MGVRKRKGLKLEMPKLEDYLDKLWENDFIVIVLIQLHIIKL